MELLTTLLLMGFFVKNVCLDQDGAAFLSKSVTAFKVTVPIEPPENEVKDSAVLGRRKKGLAHG